MKDVLTHSLGCEKSNKILGGRHVASCEVDGTMLKGMGTPKRIHFLTCQIDLRLHQLTCFNLHMDLGGQVNLSMPQVKNVTCTSHFFSNDLGIIPIIDTLFVNTGQVV